MEASAEAVCVWKQVCLSVVIITLFQTDFCNELSEHAFSGRMVNGRDPGPKGWEFESQCQIVFVERLYWYLKNRKIIKDRLRRL